MGDSLENQFRPHQFLAIDGVDLFARVDDDGRLWLGERGHGDAGAFPQAGCSNDAGFGSLATSIALAGTSPEPAATAYASGSLTCGTPVRRTSPSAHLPPSPVARHKGCARSTGVPLAGTACGGSALYWDWDDSTDDRVPVRLDLGDTFFAQCTAAGDFSDATASTHRPQHNFSGPCGNEKIVHRTGEGGGGGSVSTAGGRGKGRRRTPATATRSCRRGRTTDGRLRCTAARLFLFPGAWGDLSAPLRAQSTPAHRDALKKQRACCGVL